MPTEKEVYDAHADQYELLILREDYQNNLPKEINLIKDTHGVNIVELGAGTGRLTRFLAKDAAHIAASDLSHHMLSQAKDVLEDQKLSNAVLCVADMRQTPYTAASADMIIAGWSFCYLAVWGGDDWKRELELGLEEANRLLRPGGVMIMLENFGTGFENPNPPQHLNGYFEFLRQMDSNPPGCAPITNSKTFRKQSNYPAFSSGKTYPAKLRKMNGRCCLNAPVSFGNFSDSQFINKNPCG